MNDFGLPSCDVAALRVKSAKESATVIQKLLSGETGPAADIVTANTAAGLIAAEEESDLKQAVARVQQVLADGLAGQKLAQLVQWTQQAGADA